MGFLDTAAGIAGGGIFSKSLRKKASNFLFGTPEKHKRVSTLRDEQEPLYQQLVNAGLNPGAGGAFGTAADYYRDLLSDNPADLAAYANPELRRYHEDIMPSIAEQYAGMGSGGLSSSGFQNAAIQGATDLSERIAAIRANLRQSGAAGLQNIGGMGLQNFSQDVMTQPGTQGFVSSVAPAAGTAIGAAVGGPAGAAIGSGIGSWFGGKGAKIGANTSPYGSNSMAASPQTGFQLPNFQYSNRGF